MSLYNNSTVLQIIANGGLFIKTYHGYSDGELVALSLRGDNDAYCELVIRCKGAVLAVVRKIVPDYHAVEDVAQECFIDAYLHLPDLLERDKVYAWFCGI